MKIKLLRIFISQSLQEVLIDRKSAMLGFLIGFIFFGVEIIAGMVFFDYTDVILGWSRTDYLMLVSTSSGISFIYQTLFVVSHENLTERILEGELEPFLLKPINSLFYFSFNRMDISSLLNLIICIFVQVYYFQYYTVSIFGILLFISSMLLGACFIFILNQLAISLSFWVENAESVLGVPEYLVEFSSRPMDIYPTGVRFVFTWIIPILVGVNLPLLIIKNESYWVHYIFLIIMDVIGLFLVNLVWRAGIKHYVSAN